MPKKAPHTISDALKKVIADSGLTLYRISKDTGVVKTSLMRFVSGEQYLRLDNADKLARYFGLELVAKAARRRPGPKPRHGRKGEK